VPPPRLALPRRKRSMTFWGLTLKRGDWRRRCCAKSVALEPNSARNRDTNSLEID